MIHSNLFRIIYAEFTQTKRDGKGMKKNVGLLDRFFRLGIGVLSLSIVFASPGFILQLIFGVTALFTLATSILAYCPINEKLGLDTRKKREK